MAPNYTVRGKLDEGKRYPKRFDRRAIGIHMGDYKVSDGSESAESQITNYRLVNWWRS
jgi:hypothetical protein